MKIKYWTSFSKRKNSTKQPSGGTEVDVTLKQPCSLEAPSFILNDSNAFNISYVSAFGHYYFVTDKTYLTNDTVQVDCVQDVLATYKTNIGSTSALIARSSTVYDTHLKDDMVSIKNSYVAEESSPYSFVFDEEGCFILSCVNNHAAHSGYVANYVLTYSEFRAIAVWMSGGGNYGPDTYDDVVAFFVTNVSDVLGCIRAVKWIPLPYSTVSAMGSSGPVYLGKYNTNVTGVLINTDALYHDGGSVTISQIMGNDFRAADPYASVDVFIPYYGIVSLPPQYCVNGIQYTYYVDVINGECFVRLYSMGTGQSKLLASVSYNIGVETPIAQAGRNAGAAIQSAVGAMAGLASGSPLLAMKEGVGIISAFAQSGISAKGTQGGRAMAHYNELVVYVTTHDTTSPDDLTALYGRPCMQVLQINTLSGYVQCIDASVAISGPAEDRDQINTFLNSGFYYE